MKRGIGIVGIMLLFIAASGQEITVRSDRDVDADFSNYKTFAFSSQVDDKLDAGLFFLNDLVLKAQVREAVENELTGLGYKKDQAQPDFLVNFRLFEEPVKLKGFEGYGSTFWGGESYRNISDTTTYNLEAGSLLISLVDREQGAIVWRGFASGLIDGDKFVKDEGKIREAVNLIFEEYHQRASEYSRR